MEGVVDAICPLCCLEDEDLVHMLTRCPALSETRNTYMRNIKQNFEAVVGSIAWSEHMRDSSTLVQVIVDCRKMVLNLNLNSLLVKRQIDNPTPGAVTGGN